MDRPLEEQVYLVRKLAQLNAKQLEVALLAARLHAALVVLQPEERQSVLLAPVLDYYFGSIFDHIEKIGLRIRYK